MVAAKAADHGERGDRDAAQRETGIAGERRFEHADRIAGQPIIVGDRAIERGGRSRARRRASSPCWSLAIDWSSRDDRNASGSPRNPRALTPSSPAFDRASSFGERRATLSVRGLRPKPRDPFDARARPSSPPARRRALAKSRSSRSRGSARELSSSRATKFARKPRCRSSRRKRPGSAIACIWRISRAWRKRARSERRSPQASRASTC